MNFQYCGPWKMQICKLSSNFPEEEKFEKEKIYLFLLIIQMQLHLRIFKEEMSFDDTNYTNFFTKVDAHIVSEDTCHHKVILWCCSTFVSVGILLQKRCT